MYIDAKLIESQIVGGELLSLSLITHDILYDHQYGFKYCLSVCLYVKNQKPVLIFSNLSDEGYYSLFFEILDDDANSKRLNKSQLSEDMSCVMLEAHTGKKINNIYVCESQDHDVLSFNVKLSDGAIINIVSAEVDDFEDGYTISSPEEMVLVFESVTEAKKFDLEIYDFS
jgi:hypothetical protein